MVGGSPNGNSDSTMFVKNKVPFDRSININPVGLTLIALFALGFVYVMFGSGIGMATLGFGSSGSEAGPGEVSLRQLLTVAVEAAKRGGKEVKRVRDLVRGLSYTK